MKMRWCLQSYFLNPGTIAIMSMLAVHAATDSAPADSGVLAGPIASAGAMAFSISLASAGSSSSANSSTSNAFTPDSSNASESTQGEDNQAKKLTPQEKAIERKLDCAIAKHHVLIHEVDKYKELIGNIFGMRWCFPPMHYLNPATDYGYDAKYALKVVEADSEGDFQVLRELYSVNWYMTHKFRYNNPRPLVVDVPKFNKVVINPLTLKEFKRLLKGGEYKLLMDIYQMLIMTDAIEREIQHYKPFPGLEPLRLYRPALNLGDYWSASRDRFNECKQTLWLRYSNQWSNAHPSGPAPPLRVKTKLKTIVIDASALK